MGSEPFLRFSGRLYQQPGVRLFLDDGRSFLRRPGEPFDLIVATMVHTWAATAARAFALTENNLYLPGLARVTRALRAGAPPA
jgi:spermidine synthase